ncbi:hypothetical protein DPMN_037184 [Dreissena polymorpha]|uniref:Uncharacterized protein n=1 Tax=Dreissena polymorpha TaxID=45954 RepID=A0A9D4RNV6_DREPO|nr:hypothetical protein DPMN_037184 [Dreissena polymorpha]
MARQRPTRLVMGPCIVEIDRIVIREVQYQLEVNRCRNEEIIVKAVLVGWPMWAGRPRIDCIVIKDESVLNEEIIVKGNFEWVWPMWAGRRRFRLTYQFAVNRCRNEFWVDVAIWAGRPRDGMGPCIAEIDRIVIREVQYQFEVNRCKNEEIIVKGNFGWAWLM